MTKYSCLPLYLAILSIFSVAPAQAQEAGFIQNLLGHRYEVHEVAFSPDGKYLVSAGGIKDRPGEVLLWEVATGRKVFSFQGHPDVVKAACFSPDGKYLFTAGGYDRQQNIMMWDVQTGQRRATLSGHEAVHSMKMSADGNYLVTGGLDKQVKIWDMRTMHVAKTLSGHSEFVLEVAISPDGKYVASAAGNYQARKGELKVWNRTTGELIYNLGLFGEGHKNAVASVDFSPDSRYLASGSEDGTLTVWDLSTGKAWKDLTEPYTQISRVRFSPDGNFLAAASRSKTIKLWGITPVQKLFTYRGHFKGVNAIAFDAKGKYLASGGMDRAVKLWRAIPYQSLIEREVQAKIKTWQQKGKYEKSSAYQARVNPTTLRQQVQKYTDEVIQNLASERVEWRVQKSEYDADNETFKLYFNDLSPIYVRVPANEAPTFDRNLADLHFVNPRFTLGPDDQFVAMHVEVNHPSLKKIYKYDSQQAIAFNANQLNLNLDPVEVDVPVFTQNDNRNNSPSNSNNSNRNYGISEVDYQLPRTRMDNPDAVAVVIGNRDYDKTKDVEFAVSDARSVRNYLIDVMGFKAGNIIYLENASYTDFKLVFGSKENPRGKLYNTVKPGQSDVFVFYSGHGAPGLKDQKAYFVPTECDPQYVELTGFSADVFYNNLAKLPSRSTVVVLDACFSGEDIYDNISPIVIKSKGALGLKDGALLASSQADQVSTWYPEKRHGMFTYFFLKAIHNKNADINQDDRLTLEEIHTYIADQSEGIPYYARRIHGIEQNPVIKGQNPQHVLVEY